MRKDLIEKSRREYKGMAFQIRKKPLSFRNGGVIPMTAVTDVFQTSM